MRRANVAPELSDHSPIWIQWKTDSGEDFLKQKTPIGSCGLHRKTERSSFVL
jgi:hypothetical protein